MGTGSGAAAGMTTAPAVNGITWSAFLMIRVVTMFVDGVKGSEQNIGGVLQNAGPSPDRVVNIGATTQWDGFFL